LAFLLCEHLRKKEIVEKSMEGHQVILDESINCLSPSLINDTEQMFFHYVNIDSK